jgi:hypothetical protein
VCIVQGTQAESDAEVREREAVHRLQEILLTDERPATRKPDRGGARRQA